MKFSKAEFAGLLSASYDPKLYNVLKFMIDKKLSDKLVKVYTINGSNDVVVVHRGSADGQDWVDNTLHAFDISLKLTKSYKMHLRRQMRAVQKYGKDNIVCLGHSRGGLYCQQFYRDKLCKQSVVYNKPVMQRDIISGFFGKTDEKNQVVRTSGDLVSIGQNLINKSNDIVIPSKSINVLDNHKTDKIHDLDDSVVIGYGAKPHSGPFDLLKEYIDYSKIRKSELLQILKPYKKELNIKLTNITKPDMIKYIKQII
jgi:hypothetical protein